MVTQRNFTEKREKEWLELERVIQDKKLLKERAAWFPQACRRVSGDLNTARSHGFDPALADRLNRLTLEGSQILYRKKPFSGRFFFDFLFKLFPRSVRAEWRSFWACFLVFFGLALFSAMVCLRFPGFVYELMPRQNAAALEAMYDPAGDHYLKPRKISTDADMFGFYIYNNISIAFQAFAAGAFAGIGSLLILAFNGIFTGAAAAHVINKGFQNTFFSFIAGHSGFELTALVLAAQGGLTLGYALFITRGLTRGESLKKAGRTALPIIAGSSLMLLMAAFIEAFWSSRHEIPQKVRLCAGALIIVLLAFYFLAAGRKK